MSYYDPEREKWHDPSSSVTLMDEMSEGERKREIEAGANRRGRWWRRKGLGWRAIVEGVETHGLECGQLVWLDVVSKKGEKSVRARVLSVEAARYVRPHRGSMNGGWQPRTAVCEPDNDNYSQNKVR